MHLQKLPAVVKRQIRTVALPPNYEAAKRALQSCGDIDECKSWADRMAAMASYYKQAKDTSLEYLARRIKLRAEVRIGEILESIPRANAIGPRRGEGFTGCKPNPMSRRAVGETIGLSKNNVKRFTKAARAPPNLRERLIERNPPPHLEEIASLATGKVVGDNGQFKAGEDYRLLMNGVGGVGAFSRWIDKYPAGEFRGRLRPDEAARFRRTKEKIEAWLDEMDQVIPPDPVFVIQTSSPQLSGVLTRGVGKTHCDHGHPLSGDNLYIKPNGYRSCKTCRAVAKRKSMECL